MTPDREFLRARIHQREWMDDPGIEESRFVGALNGLRRVNAVTRSSRIVWSELSRWACSASGPLRVLDVGCGPGDGVVSLLKRFRHRGVSHVAVDGCDINEVAIARAQELARESDVDANFFKLDATRDAIPAGYDVIVSSLFLHHLPQDEAAAFLRASAAAARIGVIVHDLVRSRAGWWLAYSGVRLLLCNEVCREDGPRSVECAFTLDEARGLALEAGLDNALVRPRFPFRFILTWERP